MAEAPQISVVIPAHNAASTLGEQLTALTNQQTTLPFEVVVVDNGSTDSTAALLREYEQLDPRIASLLANAMNTPGYSRNAGVAIARASKLAFCDADDVVEPDWVETMAAALDEHAVVQGKIDYTMLNPPWMHEVRGSTAVDRLGYTDGVFPYVVSACLGVRRQAFDLAGGFDEQMRVGQDVEFSWRLFQAGIDVGFDERVQVNYRLRTTASANFRQSTNYGRARMEIRRRMRAAGFTDVVGVKWRNLLWLARHVGTTITRAGRYRWLVVAGNLWGEIRGPAPLIERSKIS